MNVELIVRALQTEAQGLISRCARLVARGGSAELTSRLRVNAERVVDLSMRIKRMDAAKLIPADHPERSLLFGEWRSARWVSWPRQLTVVLLAKMSALGALSPEKSTRAWERYVRNAVKYQARKSA